MSPDFFEKTCQDSTSEVKKGPSRHLQRECVVSGWHPEKGDNMVADVEELEIFDTSEIHAQGSCDAEEGRRIRPVRRWIS